ncbi:enoyl-CoA hydratase [Evansella cellulosilytica]|uniref:Enoyl-CoA hydratase/isomerase n=1 Tax=Evansella cellulosilytica (strain ATCC 21833 / DSM 2522 / FERM P-1141 / JCM 9156 / N-4) TaxID=649639 RepID=E6U0G2_EVAC2|nr:enoyl-CoA hydratase [Evansella cellulosilytica]ADU31407.1 Enoyl-CoA hydratase/isomerase [Evansella cellulosilytica DSM 2522]
MFAYLELEVDDKVALVKINHPPANTLSQALLQELSDIFDELHQNEEVKVVLLYGEGRYFAAGADIKEFSIINGNASFYDLSRKGQLLFDKIEAFSKPVIAAVHGAALGGGLELAMAAHIRVVATDAKLGLPELQLGLIPGFGGTHRLSSIVGKAKATELILTSKPISGEEAVRLGLANTDYPEETLLEEAKELARLIATKSSLSVKRTLQLLRHEQSREESNKLESTYFHEVMRTQDATEGIQAFIEKRTPIFKDR